MTDAAGPRATTGGSWEHIYIQNGADLYARVFDDENMRDYTIAFAQMSAAHMRSRKCHQTWYYAAFDVEAPGTVHDPWTVLHAETEDGQGCEHSGWYTRFYPDACAKGYSLTGEPHLLEQAAAFWKHGSHSEYHSRATKPLDRVNQWVRHEPPKNDRVLSVSRLMLETARPRARHRAARGHHRPRGQADARWAGRTDLHRAGGGRRPLPSEVRRAADSFPTPPGTRRRTPACAGTGGGRTIWRASRNRVRRAGANASYWRTSHRRPQPSAVRSFDAASNRSAISNLAQPSQR